MNDIIAGRHTVAVALTLEERVRMCQAADADVARLGKTLEAGEAVCEAEYRLVEGLLYRCYRSKLLFVMPKQMRKLLVVVAHDLSGHPAVDRTVANELQDFWFTGVRRYVKQHIHMCFECLLTRKPRGK